ncbi:MAG: mandelate racemase/muconate lactonizing enzyme family protein [Burkholderiales bacterium]
MADAACLHAARRLKIGRIDTRLHEKLVEVAVAGNDGTIGVAVVPRSPGLVDALDRMRSIWLGDDALAFERRWHARGGDHFESSAQRFAFSALELATADFAANALGITVAELFGTCGETRVAQVQGSDDPEAVLDYDAIASPAALAKACLARNAVEVRFSLSHVGGPQGLRSVLAVARVFNLAAVAKLATSDERERLLATSLAAAFGFSIDPGLGIATTHSTRSTHLTRASRSRPGTTIRRIRLRRVKVPLRQVYVSAMYLTDHVLRTLIEIESDDGVMGLGETLGAEDVFRLVAGIAKGMIGASPFDRRSMARRYARIIYENRNGRNGWQAFAGLEVACHDILGKSLDLSLADWLGSTASVRSLRVVSLIPTAILDRVVPREELASVFADSRNTERVARYARRLHDVHGITCFKYKSSGIGLEWDVAAIRALREALGPAVGIRFDPNAAYDTATALTICRALESFGLCWVEDPTDGIEGLARLRARLAAPIATNMAVVQFDHLAPAARQRAIDVVLGDTLHWGGVEGLRDLSAACDALRIALANHAFYECGVAAAANLHVAIGLGLTRHAHDQAHDGLMSDLLTDDVLAIRNGRITLPNGTGLGVTLDADRVREFQIEQLDIA